MESPMMQKWKKIRDQLDSDVILFFRMGDFYELFYDDAKIVHRELGFTLISRNAWYQIISNNEFMFRLISLITGAVEARAKCSWIS